MNGAESLLTTLVNNGVEVCFTNPGTSEMHFVAALDEVDGMRCILCLFEGVLTGAADGYARMARKPASTLLHLGPGFGNSLANVHNARKGNIPMVNIIGDHATYHLEYDAPLTSDIKGIAGPVSHWVKSSDAAGDIARDAAEAVKQAGIGEIATLILPADVSWGDNPNGAEAAVSVIEPTPVDASRIASAAERLRAAENPVLMVGGREITAEQGRQLSRIGKAVGGRVMTETFPARCARGAGTAVLDRLAYLAEIAIDSIKDVDLLVLVGCKSPVSFFAYPNVPSAIAPESCEELALAGPNDDIDNALAELVEILGASDFEPELCALNLPDKPSGSLDANSVAQSLAHFLPENAIIVDEGVTSGLACMPLTAEARPHDWLNQTGGAIGWGLPAAVGAAVACPERKVICLEGDGSAMYTIQSLWTMAREALDVTVIIFNNRKYSILEMEFGRTGARGGAPGPKAASTLDIGKPDMDFVAMAQGMGVRAARADSAEAFNELLEAALAAEGPFLIDAIVPTLFS
ncbi:MAG: acetolactate synthase large subunit [Pseudomonadota bacterium]